MIEVDAARDGTRARRRTWLVGGVLIALSAMLALGSGSVQNLLATGLPFDISQVLFHAGVVVLAVGLGAAGSVTARKPLGTGAIIALAVWQLLATPLLWTLVNPTGMMIEATAEGGPSSVAMISTTFDAIALALAIIAVVQIGRIGVVPRPWNWAPLWVLALIVGLNVLVNGSLIAGSIADQTLLFSLFGFASLLRLIAIVGLGVLAIVLALRPATGSTVVYGSGS